MADNSNTLFDLDTLEVKADTPQPKQTKPRFYIEVVRNGQRAALVEMHVDTVRFMYIDLTHKQQRPHLYKSLAGAQKEARRHQGAVVKAWTGKYE